MNLRTITEHSLNTLSDQARRCERLRMNYNFHASTTDNCQRMLNALEPGTEIPIHRHEVDETFVLLRGSLKVLIYSDEGTIDSEIILNPNSGVYGVEIPAHAWHTVQVLEKNTVIFETREGPYVPRTKDSILEIR